LPQVPVEQGWNLDEYLDYICVKAGLPAGSYDAPDAKLYAFTAVVFGEE
jgi:AMMECR1 domain-containing protein